MKVFDSRLHQLHRQEIHLHMSLQQSMKTL